MRMRSVLHDPHIETIKKFRIPCLGECGTMVLRDRGECRHCRKDRIRRGRKLLAKLKKQDKAKLTTIQKKIKKNIKELGF